ncbi:MAG: hemerythrin domain-containing protein [Polaromonas sp.]|uniref:hemerythrin domain-containing protein n=1 Tax=Polaromonas sp. TaxID=1869339 RepID=UPI002731A1C0|nr:hemerythrin domain-containing protein [Polaromonas sp.]MDP1740442.1 hemerythrin domain-containing protein [Polaromonas sp.]MDP1953059.1 hemerythrin domain-containing protein [Polaromonas sp.]MDP3354879.1 hemerythrin domain-containing protein [Polaromonas sp.]MDP3751529.1 hemerythrin domain-containing protein [Polaromonas sp.]
MSTDPAASDMDTSNGPLTSFSQCHVGILSQLQAFEELPVLQAAAVRARTVAAQTLSLFREAVFVHHADEENELFPAVLRSAVAGPEADKVRAIIRRLTEEHRMIEARWKSLEPAVRAVAKASASDLDTAAVQELAQAYTAHARFEEEQFLPLAQTILSRNGNHMEALGLSLHLRHAPQPMAHI